MKTSFNQRWIALLAATAMLFSILAFTTPAGAQLQEDVIVPPANAYRTFEIGGFHGPHINNQGQIAANGFILDPDGSVTRFSAPPIVTDFNDSGDVLGYLRANATEYQIRHADGALEVVLGPDGRNVPSAREINNVGEVLFNYNPDAQVSQAKSAIRLVGGDLQLLESANTTTEAWVLNDHGEAAGMDFVEEFNDNGEFLRLRIDGAYWDSDGQIEPVLIPGSTRVIMNDINNAGTALGYSEIDNQFTNFFRYRDGTITNLALADNELAIYLSDSEHVVVRSILQFSVHANDQRVLVNVPGSTETRVTSINNLGQVAGRYKTAAGIDRGFVLDYGSLVSDPGEPNPADPLTCVVTVIGDGFKIEWTGGEGADRYVVSRTVSGSPYFWRTSVTNNEYLDSFKAGDVRYRVTLVTDLGDRVSSDCSSVAEEGIKSCSVTQEGDAFKTSFQASPGAEIIVRRSVDGGTKWWRGRVQLDDLGNGTFLDSSRSGSLRYEVSLVGVDGEINDPFDCGEVQLAAVATVLSCSMTVVDGDTFRVSWMMDQPDTAAIAHVVERSVDGGTFWWRGRTTESEFEDSFRSGDVVYRVISIGADGRRSEPVLCELQNGPEPT